MSVTPDVTPDVKTEEAAPPKAPGRRRRSRRAELNPGERRLALTLVLPTIILLAVVIGYPVVRAIFMSFQKDPGLDPNTGFFVSGGFAGFSNYTHWLLQQCPQASGGTVSCPPGTLGGQFYDSVFTTVFFTVCTVIIEVVLGMWMAIVMNRAFRGRALLRASVLVPWAIPTAVTAKLWAVVFDPQGILNKLLGTSFQWTSSIWPARTAIVIADVWKTTPFIALLILAGLQGISADLYEAARIDGATAWQRFTKITLPLVKPALGVAVIFRSLDVLRMYDLPKILTGGANGTNTLSIEVVNQLTSGINSASALSTITFIFIFAIAFLMVRLFHANLTAGARR
jgi:ABC-type sugar transport system permease subunit